jgi:hypothetical protein
MKKFTLVTATLILGFMLVQPAQARLGIGDPAPDFTLNDVNNDPHSLSDYTHRVVMLNWWATY